MTARSGYASRGRPNTSTEHYAYLFREAGLPDGMMIYEDLGFSNGLFCSPATYRELIMPYHKELFGFFHSYGLPVILHTCGDVRKAIPMLIEAGIDCLQPMEAKAGCDIVELAELYGDKIAFMGNIDVTVLNRNDRKVVREEIARKIPALKRLGAAYIFHSDHSVPPAPGWRSAGSGGGWGRGRDRMSRPDSFRGREREVVPWVELDGEGVL